MFVGKLKNEQTLYIAKTKKARINDVLVQLKLKYNRQKQNNRTSLCLCDIGRIEKIKCQITRKIIRCSPDRA